MPGRSEGLGDELSIDNVEQPKLPDAAVQGMPDMFPFVTVFPCWNLD